MKFIIVNRTRFRTSHLRSFVVRAYKIAKEHAGPTKVEAFERNYRRVTITFARSNRRDNGASTGHGHYNRPQCHVGIQDKPNRIDVAMVIAHEFGHCFGMHHGDMRGGPLDAYEWRKEPEMQEMRVRVFGWGDALRLEHRPLKRQPARGTTERYTAEITRVHALMRSWHTKQKRAVNALKKLHAKEKRLMRALANTTNGDTP